MFKKYQNVMFHWEKTTEKKSIPMYVHFKDEIYKNFTRETRARL